MSARRSTCLAFLNCSGAMCVQVPMVVIDKLKSWTLLFGVSPARSSFRSFANPKSVTLRTPSAVIRQLRGLMSRCARIPLANA